MYHWSVHCDYTQMQNWRWFFKFQDTFNNVVFLIHRASRELTSDWSVRSSVVAVY